MKYKGNSMKNENYDLIIIGGGATGSGIAVDAASRGIKTLLLEKKWFFQKELVQEVQKLVHGGVRYLEKAVKHLDINQFNLVKEGLKREIKTF